MGEEAVRPQLPRQRSSSCRKRQWRLKRPKVCWRKREWRRRTSKRNTGAVVEELVLVLVLAIVLAIGLNIDLFQSLVFAIAISHDRNGLCCM